MENKTVFKIEFETVMNQNDDERTYQKKLRKIFDDILDKVYSGDTMAKIKNENGEIIGKWVDESYMQ